MTPIPLEQAGPEPQPYDDPLNTRVVKVIRIANRLLRRGIEEAEMQEAMKEAMRGKDQ